MSRTAESARLRTVTRAALGAAVAAVVAAVLLLPYWAALAVAAPVMFVSVRFIVHDAMTLRRLSRDLAAKRAASNLMDRVGGRPGAAEAADHERRFQRVFDALDGGFPDSAMVEARRCAASDRIPHTERLRLMRSVLDWFIEEERQSRADVPRREFDVVFISHLGLPGGNTSASVADIRMCREAGLKVGLVHHPIYKWGPNAPLNPRIEELIDGESVALIGLGEEVECALAVVRLPTVMMKPLERRPRIIPGHTVVIANQTPFKFYGENGGRAVAWNFATVEQHVTDWLGPHTWYAGGPLVYNTLLERHAEEIADLDLAAVPWPECIDVDDWRLDRRRPADGRIRIGRHTRDHKLKWPEDAQTLLQCYPDREPFEISVLGGADVPTGILGELPSNWTSHEFNSLSAKEFLAQIDIFVYFISSDGMEAFGRAPLEAMAAGVPVIMDRRFEPTFGSAAIYCEPWEVAATAEQLMTTPGAYAEQRSIAWAYLAERCSARSLMDRFIEHMPADDADFRFRGAAGRDPQAAAVGGAQRTQVVTAEVDYWESPAQPGSAEVDYRERESPAQPG
jgi:hypothetical protein